MSKHIPEVRQFMTQMPCTIRPDLPLAEAHKIMREHQIRHLPVLDGGTLRGIVTMRDLHLIETLKDVDPRTVTVEDAMSQDVYTVTPEAALDEVAASMAERRLGSAVVVQDNKVVGIFTAVDGLTALAEVLRARGGATR